MALIRCWECGARISESAVPCPQCWSSYPKGVQCVICSEWMKASDALFSAIRSERHMHRRCGASLFDHRGHCRECGSTIWGGWFSSSWDWELGRNLDPGSGRYPESGQARKCEKCGILNPLLYLGQCSTCHLPVFRQLHEVSSVGIQHRWCEERKGTS